MIFLDFMGGGAWPFLVGGLICLLNCDNERDPNLLNSETGLHLWLKLLFGLVVNSGDLGVVDASRIGIYFLGKLPAKKLE